MARLRKSIEDMEAGKGKIHEVDDGYMSWSDYDKIVKKYESVCLD